MRNQRFNNNRKSRMNRKVNALTNKERVSNKKTIIDSTRNQNKLVILSEPGRFCPERIFCKLVLTDPVMSRGNIGDDVANWYYQSSVFNPDPLNTGETIPGFAELANLYFAYRVHSITSDIEMYNQNTEAMILSVWPSNTLYNANSLTHDEILELGSNPQCKTTMCGTSNGMGRARLRTTASAHKLIGPQYARDDDYASSTSGNPTTMFYLNVGVCDCVGNMTFNPVFRTKLTYEVEFFKPRTLMS